VWNSKLDLTVNAPELSISELRIENDDNSDGILDAGETGDITFTVTNVGHADASFEGILSEVDDANDYLTLNSTATSLTSIAVGENVDVAYSSSADASTPFGAPVSVQLDVADETGNYTASSVQKFNIGVVPVYPISDEGTLTVCTGLFYDSGLEDNDYSNDEDYTMTFVAGDEGKMISLDFVEFNVEAGYDYLKVYNGLSTSNDLIGTFDNSEPLTVITANNDDGALTFVFHSDYSETGNWKAEVSCVEASGINDIAFDEVKIYPNPTKGIVTISTTNYYNSKIDVFSLNGKKVYSINAVSDKTNIDLSSYVKGIYFIKVTSDNNVSNFKIVVQ
ncbi:MAG: T9SS type A sorting domain-containing protein, partial [Chlorobi bacterium]|nr:T9SS type A sorting domain-containing protein [Chlorobiota bacterium]